MKKIFKNLGKWQSYVYYLLLAGSVFFIHWMTDVLGIEMAAVNGGVFQWVGLFLFYAFGLLIFDTLIHMLFYVLPKPYRWRD